MLIPALVLAATLLDPSQRLQQQLGGGEQHEYMLQLRTGAFARVVVEQQGIDVVVSALAPDGRTLAEVDSPNGANGPEPVSIAATVKGGYRITVRSFDAKAPAGKYTIRVDELLSPAAYRQRLAGEQRRDAAVVAWLKSRALPLHSVSPGSRFSDLAPLRTLLRDVRVVGLGEATHGSHELFTVKHRLIELLVRELGFRVVAFEGSAAATGAINDYILGKGDRAPVLAAFDAIWITANDELLAMIDWLREYNATAAEADRVHFAGLDPHVNGPAIDDLTRFLRAHAPGTGTRVQPLLDLLRSEDEKAGRFERTSVPVERVHEIQRLIAFLVTNEGDFVRRGGQDDYARALDTARLLAQFAEFNSSLPAGEGGTRDGYMAANLFRALQSRPEARAIVWAHNAHISASDRSAYKPLGAHLRAAYGDAYYAFATAFARGTFLAQVPGSTPPDVRTFTITAPPAGSIDAMLAATNTGASIIDLRNATPPDPRVAAWLAIPQRMHWIGALYTDSWTEAQRAQPFLLGHDFDGIIFLDKTIAARTRFGVR
jgi:erythromycin esterase